MRVKDPPCINCPYFTNCQQYFVQRKKVYEADRDMCEDYNSESFAILSRKCKPLNEYLLMDMVSNPSRNEHFFWFHTMESRISESAWTKRLNLFRNVWELVLVPGTM